MHVKQEDRLMAPFNLVLHGAVCCRIYRPEPITLFKLPIMISYAQSYMHLRLQRLITWAYSYVMCTVFFIKVHVVKESTLS